MRPSVDPGAEGNGGYVQRWWIMVIAWLIGLVAGIIGVMEKIGWTALGIDPVLSNWLLVIAGVAVVVSGALASFPTYPDPPRKRAERALHWERKLAKPPHH